MLHKLFKLVLITNHPIKQHKRLAKGLIYQKRETDVVGTILSFVNSFNPSAIGCKTPQKPIIPGPERLCILAIILRSARVKKAVAINTGKITIKGKNKKSFQI